MTTATNETPVERRLRKLMQRADADNQGETADAIDAGREAIALLCVILVAVDDGDVCRSDHCQCECSAAVKAARQLIARCGGQEGT